MLVEGVRIPVMPFLLQTSTHCRVDSLDALNETHHPKSSLAVWDRPLLPDIGLVGLSLLMLLAFQVHGLVRGNGGRLVTVLGGFLMTVGHVRNYRLCQIDHCSV